MYLENIRLENTGPIERLEFNCKFINDKPCPIVLVGPNGCGKSFAISYILNAIFQGQSILYMDSEVPKNQFYKYIGSNFIRRGNEFSISELQFSNNFYSSEVVFFHPMNKIPTEIVDTLKFKKLRKLDGSKHIYLGSNIWQRPDELRDEFESSSLLYFPPNRFEVPTWNHAFDSDIKPTMNTDKRDTLKYSRRITIYNPMTEIKDWLLNIHLDELRNDKVGWKNDSFDENERQLEHLITSPDKFFSKMTEFTKLLFKIGQEEALTWDLGYRNYRTLGFSINDERVVDDLFSLSTGQIVILDIFWTIMKDQDFVLGNTLATKDFEGIVIIEDIDLHLHTEHQYELLPKLIKFFPDIQFIITTHSPFFLMGMSENFSNESIQVIDVKKGTEIEIEQFSEIGSAYNFFMNSTIMNKYTNLIKSSEKNIIVFVEGDLDIKYIKHASRELNETDLMNNLELVQVSGNNNLRALWNAWKKSDKNWTNNKVILLFDCDCEDTNADSNNIFLRKVPLQNNPLKKGIENLFDKETIDEIKKIDDKYFDDITHTGKTRGRIMQSKNSFNINKQEKSNLCNWLCNKRNTKYFKNFKIIFDIIREVKDA